MSSPAPAERSLFDRYLAVLPFVVAGLALLSLLFWEAASRRTPTIYTDEFEWAQLSRAIAATGHAARRGHAIGFKSLYAFLIAPFWWIHSVGAAYAAIKYVNAIVMMLSAIPTYLLARTMVSARLAAIAALASICTTALYYAGFLLPEVLAYPTFTLCAFVSIRALAGAGRRWIVAAIVLDLLATQVRSELVVLPVSAALAATVLWVVGPTGRRLRRNWGVFEHLGAAVLLIVMLLVLNRLAGPHAAEWHKVTESWQGRMWSLGMQASEALALGLGLLPLVGGLASLWLPDRRDDPRWRAYAAFTASAIVTVWTYTAVKAAYLSTVFATRVEERNMIYLGPLLLVGTVVWLSSRRRWLPGTLAAWAFTTWLVIYYGYQLDFPYFEAPGYGIATMANRSWHWDQPTIRIGLAIASGILLAVLLVLHTRRIPTTIRAAVIVIAAATTITWMLTAEITSSRGSAIQSKNYAAGMPQPLDWIDRSTGQAPTTFIGENISTGDDLGIDLLEFWNRSIKNVWSLDGSAPGPGPTQTPDLSSRYGNLSHDPGYPYVVATDGVNLIGPNLAFRKNLTLTHITHHPWRLQRAVYGVSSDGWISGSTDLPVATGTYAYFGPETTPGTVSVRVARSGFCPKDAPATHITIRVGPVTLNEQRAATVAQTVKAKGFTLPNCAARTIHVIATPPLAVVITADPTIRPSDYGETDNRELGAQVGFSFTPKR